MVTSVIVGLLVIAGIWSVYLLPVVFGDRRSIPMSSTEAFDRWSHSMANVQKQSVSELAASQREVIRQRRRRTLVALVFLALGALFAAWRFQSLPWLLSASLFGTLTVAYLMMLAQMRQRRNQRLKVTHVAERPTEWEEPQIKVIAN
jgi:hypothetical protein